MIGDPILTADIGARWVAVRRRIERAADLARRDPAEIQVVAVTKGFGIDVVRAAWAAGLTRFGENRVQEAEPKIAVVPDAEWHLVGHLQSNKTRRAVAGFDMIQSVDSVELLDRLEAVTEELDLARAALLQVNLTGGATQHGFDRAWFQAATADGSLPGTLAERPGRVRIVGLMGIGPFTDDPRASRAAFVLLRGLRDRLQEAMGLPLPDLSMGMSADLEIAVEQGATLVRVGTALFGDRPEPG